METWNTVETCISKTNKLMPVFHVCPVIDHEFGYNIVKESTPYVILTCVCTSAQMVEGRSHS